MCKTHYIIRTRVIAPHIALKWIKNNLVKKTNFMEFPNLMEVFLCEKGNIF